MASKKQTNTGEDKTSKSSRVGMQRAAELFAQYGTEIRAMIEYHTRDGVEADDVFQEFFLSLAAARLPDNLRNVKRYLLQAAANDVASQFRKQKRYRRRITVYAEARAERQPNDDPGQEVMRVEQTRKVFEKIEKNLPPREAMAVTSRYCRDRNVAEAAAELGVNKRSVARYVCSGLKRIRELGIAREGTLK